MNKAMATAAKRKLNAFGRMERRARIFAWLSEDWSADEVALVEKLTTRRIHQIVSDTVKKRKIHLQRDQAFLDSLLPEPALAAADGGAAGPDVAAIRTYLKFLAGVDRPQPTELALAGSGREAHERFQARLRRIAARAPSPKARTAAMAREAKSGTGDEGVLTRKDLQMLIEILSTHR
jgi:hypothetical protein